MTVSSAAVAPPEARAEREWFDEAVRRHYRLVFSISYQVLGSARDAEDAAQEAFLRAYRARTSLETPGAAEAWLARIAHNTAADLGRRRGRDEAVRRVAADRARAAAEDGAASGPSIPNGGADEERQRRMRAAIGSLPEAEAVVVALRFLEGLSATEIGARLREEPGTVRVRLHRALKRLRAALPEEI